MLSDYQAVDGIDDVVRTCMASIEGMPKIIQQSSEFFIFFGDKVYPRLEQEMEKLGGMYSPDHGRPAENPVRMLAVCLLQFCRRLPDVRAAASCQFDLRWKYALHMRSDEPAFHPSLLTVFRNRLIEHSLDRLAFDVCLDLLSEAGWCRSRGMQRLDSTHVHGLLRHMSRLECARTALRKALMALEQTCCEQQTWKRLWDEYVLGEVDFRSSVTVLRKKSAEVGRDIAWLLESFQHSDYMNIPEMKLLKQVFDENYELDEHDEWKQTPKSKPGSIQNPYDPDAQWCTKSTIKHKEWIGYKVQTCESVADAPHTKGEPTTNTITAVVTQKATGSDEAGMQEVMEQLLDREAQKPDTLYVDGAYVSAGELDKAEREARELRGPAPPSGGSRKRFRAENFNVDIADRQAVCPAGHVSTNCSRLQEGNAGAVSFRFEWNNIVCGQCQYSRKCLGKNQKHRTLLLGEHHMHLQRRRQEMQTEQFKTEMHRRNGIEGTQSELVRAYGMRNARYRGLDRVTLQNYLIASACNLCRFVRRQTWERAQATKTT